MSEQPISTLSLSGKVAVVTGGASGIGVGIATVLAEAGATVVIADSSPRPRRATSPIR